MFRKLSLALSCLVVGGVVLMARGGDDEKAELEKFAGKWKVVSITFEGKPLKAGYTQEIVGDKILFGGGWYGKIKLHTKDTPKAFDSDNYDAGNQPRGGGYKAIYEFDGPDTLKWCITQKSDAPRPKAFETKQG